MGVAFRMVLEPIVTRLLLLLSNGVAFPQVTHYYLFGHGVSGKSLRRATFAGGHGAACHSARSNAIAKLDAISKPA
jgi:hypothetical protein